MIEPFAELASLTTLRVGGPARALLGPASREELIETALAVWASGEDWLALGGGSNVVVGDDGFDGSVIRILTRGIERIGDGIGGSDSGDGGRDGSSNGGGESCPAGQVRLRVQAGEPWDALVEFAVAEGLAGIEALSGIPGSSGAAPVQNIGAYGQELADSLVAVDFLDYLSGDIERIPAERLGLGYRTSEFKRGRRGIVLSIELALTDASALSTPIAYPQLATAVGAELGDRVELRRVRDAVIALRRSKGMVLDPLDVDTASAGSFFTNPIVGEAFARGLPSDAARWPVEPDLVKLSAAWLIERAGIRRRFSLPGSRAAISTKHSLAITNTGGATAAEITELARFIQERVRNDFGVALVPEPVYVGI